MMKAYKFLKFVSIYDPETVVYALEYNRVEKLIQGVMFTEVTSDFKTSHFIRSDSLKSDGYIFKEL